MNKPQPKHELVIDPRPLGHDIFAVAGSRDMSNWIDEHWKEFGYIVSTPVGTGVNWYHLRVSDLFDFQEVVQYLIDELGAHVTS